MSSENKEVKTRRVSTPETVNEDFSEVVKMIESEVEALREDKDKHVGVRFLRSLNKKLKLLHKRADRVMKRKRRIKRTNNSTSGFLKPVNISSEMAKFTKWDPDTPVSRVEVTKYICKYIKDNDLQNPDDRRQIKPDKKLQKLLNFDPKKESEPLTYYKIQSCMKHHFKKI